MGPFSRTLISALSRSREPSDRAARKVVVWSAACLRMRLAHERTFASRIADTNFMDSAIRRRVNFNTSKAAAEYCRRMSHVASTGSVRALMSKPRCHVLGQNLLPCDQRKDPQMAHSNREDVEHAPPPNRLANEARAFVHILARILAKSYVVASPANSRIKFACGMQSQSTKVETKRGFDPALRKKRKY